jgi:hypothetical protein
MAVVNLDDLTRLCLKLADDEGCTFVPSLSVEPEGLEEGPRWAEWQTHIRLIGADPESAYALSTPTDWTGIGDSREAAMIDLLTTNGRWPV